MIEALKEQKTGIMETDDEHPGLVVEGYIETVKFTSHNAKILTLYDDLVGAGGKAGQVADFKQIRDLIIIVND